MIALVVCLVIALAIAGYTAWVRSRPCACGLCRPEDLP